MIKNVYNIQKNKYNTKCRKMQVWEYQYNDFNQKKTMNSEKAKTLWSSGIYWFTQQNGYSYTN